jgi:YHS domain-containing protein
MEKDVFAECKLIPKKQPDRSTFEGNTFYFCSPSCKKKFDANPAQYASNK